MIQRKYIKHTQKQAKKLQWRLTPLQTAQLLDYIHDELDRLITRSA